MSSPVRTCPASYRSSLVNKKPRSKPTDALDRRPGCGLVLLDEAFAKMDESRTRATLRFARELGLQLVIAAAQGKSEF